MNRPIVTTTAVVVVGVVVIIINTFPLKRWLRINIGSRP
jgi:hypothetical protein